jgi:hypothetical protein
VGGDPLDGFFCALLGIGGLSLRETKNPQEVTAMAAKKHLAAVPAGAKAKPETPKSISEALDGTSRDVLAAMRKALAKKLDAGEVSSNAIASAYKELRELDRLIRMADHDAAHAERETAHADVDDRFDASAI